MPREAKPARLWLKPADEKTASVYIIKDGPKRISTGCGPSDRAEAERQLGDYVASKYDPRRKDEDGATSAPVTADKVFVADVLAVYLEDVVAKIARPKQGASRVGRLLAWWDGKRLSDISSKTCEAYAEARGQALRPIRLKKDGTPYKPTRQGKEGSTGGARRDLEDLRSAVTHYTGIHKHIGVVNVPLPQKGKARSKYLTRDEVAAMVWFCWRHKRVQTIGRGPRKGQSAGGASYHDMRHLARFILLGAYTGSRSGPLLRASILPGPGRAYLDLRLGLYHRLPEDYDEAANKKSPTARIPRSLLAHLRRWRDRGIIAQYVVEWQGKPIVSVKNAWARAVAEAVPGGISGDPVPHTLRHSCVTWLKQQGVSSYDVANYVGMSEQMVEHVYGKYDPDHQSAAVEALSAGQRRRTKSPDRYRTDTPSTNPINASTLEQTIKQLQALLEGRPRS